MAKIGLNNFYFGELHEGTTNTYGAATSPGKAVSCSVEVTRNDATLYADDVLQENDESFQSGTVTLGIDRDDLATQAALLGHTYTAANGIVRNADDAAPYVGLARIVTMMVSGVRSYKVEFLNKVKFSEPGQDDSTKGENLEFNTVEIEGTISALANGNWSSAKVFTDKEDAVEYITGTLLGTYTAPGTP